MILADNRIEAAPWNETYPKGQVIRLDDFHIYAVGNTNSKLSMIIIYDIRGFNITQTRVFCDRLAAEYNIYVVMPDFFRGTVAPADFTQLQTWLNSTAPWSKVSVDLRSVVNWLNQSSSSNQIGLIGFCWGGLQAVLACSNMSELFFTGVSIHGSAITADVVRPLKRPMLFIAAGNDPPLQPNISSTIEQSNPNISARFIYKTYSNMRHGFVAAGANYSNPDNVQAIDDVHLTVRNFLDGERTNGGLTWMTKNIYFAFTMIFVSFLYEHCREI